MAPALRYYILAAIDVEIARPDSARSLDLLAALSHESNFSACSYCEDETRCSHSVRRVLLEERAARVA
jgi:hypothetical protein